VSERSTRQYVAHLGGRSRLGFFGVGESLPKKMVGDGLHYFSPKAQWPTSTATGTAHNIHTTKPNTTTDCNP
jgi:hypothetical protein